MRPTVLLCFLTLLLHFSCGNTTSNGGQPAETSDQSTSAYIKMKINGIPWEATSEIIGNLGMMEEGQFTLGGTHLADGEEQNFNIVLHQVTGAGTYSTAVGQTYNAVQYAVSQTTNGDVRIYKSQQDGNFTVKITRAEGFQTEGTFSGTLPGWLNVHEPAIITEGVFKTNL
ncbi:MAG: hypothetical protein R2795_05485 [Saprospiraceae bacterium]